MSKVKLITVVFTFMAILAVVFWLANLSKPKAIGQISGAPYPPSPVIDSITFHPETLQSESPGSDLWPNTWGPDDNVWVSWGDGGGFNGSNSLGRVAMGFAKISGPPENYQAMNVNGGYNPLYPASFPCQESPSGCYSKTASILFVDGTLYAWVNMQDNPYPNITIKLAWSEDMGATWELSPWSFEPGIGNLKFDGFLNFGKDYQGSRDDFVYLYGSKQEAEEGKIYLARVHRTQIKEKSAYEYFTGIIDNDVTWSINKADSSPVLENPEGAGGSVIYNPYINRYLYSGTHGAPDKLHIFDAPEPWGPWTIAYYEDNWLNTGDGNQLVNAFVNKWTSSDGLTMWMIFSCHGGCNYHDQFNLVKATLTLKGQTLISNLIPNNYQTAYLQEGSQYYLDRTYTITTIPPAYQSLLWIKTANDDKQNNTNSFLTFEVDQVVTVYVAYDQRISPIANWLANWQNEGQSIQTSIDTLNLYSQSFCSGQITLGGNYGIDQSSMYAVLIRQAQPSSYSPLDLDCSQTIDRQDLNLFKSFWQNQDLKADFDQDSFINTQDFAIMMSRWGTY